MVNPFDVGIALTSFAKLNDPLAATPFFSYPAYAGPGDADEGYDAADFQNIWLALLTVTPRAQGRVVHASGYLDANDPAVLTNATDFLRLDLEDVPMPSFHRPDLVNFWYHRLVALLVGGGMDEDDAVRAVIQPYVEASGQLVVNPNAGGLSAPQAALVAAIKRKIMMRPIREDHPRFNGSNTQSEPPNLIGRSNLTKNGQIAIPYWDAIGPWDVDNDNDGIADSIWLDFGEPVQELEDGTRYKVLVAPLIIDLDSRLNVNAHGLVDHINLGQTEFAAVQYPGNPAYVPGPNLAGGAPISSNILPQGSGYGPPEISLRPVFHAPTVAASVGNRTETVGSPATEIDDYAAVLAGRVKLYGTAVSGKYGFRSPTLAADQTATPGLNSYYATPIPPFAPPTGEQAMPDLSAQIKFFDYPATYNRLFGYSLYPFAPPGLIPVPPSAFGTPPDLKGRYALGLDYAGQPFYEAEFDQNPNNNFPNALLTDSPYELDLSQSRRREAWSSTGFASSTDDFNKSLVQNDDAPFAPADLERVLRAWDPDSSTLPSRLWDVVSEFDPRQLLNYDAYRVTAISNSMFSQSDQPNDITPAKLATAQQIAAINRRLVTTDSSNPPIPSITPPTYLMTAPAGITNPALRLKYVQALNMRPPKTVAEMLEVRIRREFNMPTLYDEYEPGGDHDGDGTPNSADPQYTSAAVVQDRLIRAARISTIISGGTWTDANNNVHVESGMLAPELLAGKRMDLNRPFGDGRDDNGNGVVDDPMEAGEPFLDTNGNGKHDSGEPWIELIDRDNNPGNPPQYDGPLDQLWPDLTAQGLLAEPITFDYTNGVGYPIHRGVAQKSPDPVPHFPLDAKVRNLESQARQLYARHLYCLMLLLVDEHYIAPWDESDPQIAAYLDTTGTTSRGAQLRIQLQLMKAKGIAPYASIDAIQETRRILLRKLTCRAIAQWAVNCVDIRDADAIMTPFEYDENPWDGWSLTQRDSNYKPLDEIALDGDPATDENNADVIDWKATLTANGAKVVSRPTPTTPGLVAMPMPLDQTRGLVWGAERPELLITETLALHDRRTEDLGSDSSQLQLNAQPGEPGQPGLDEDLDQRLRPKGSLFVEIYNPWSPTGQYPADLYSKLTRNNPIVGLAPSEGIELGRLSTLGIDKSTSQLSNQIEPLNVVQPEVKRSPVWRLVVVEEHPNYRNDAKSNKESNFDNQPDPLGTGVHKGALPARYKQDAYRPVDPDWPQFDSQYIPDNEPYIERSIYFTSDNSDRWDKGEYTRPQVPNPDDHRNSRTLLVKNPEDKLVLPPESSKSARYFIAGDVRSVLPNPPPDVIKDADVPIAPIKPGRYALIGTAGAQYLDSAGAAIPGSIEGFAGNAPRYVTAITRQYLDQEERQTTDNKHVGALNTTRRIELLPNVNPELQQVLVAGNGGTPLFPFQGNDNPNEPVQRDNELVKLPDGQFRNIFDGNGDNIPDTRIIPPCVAVPVAYMSLSEPLDLYQARRRDLKNAEPTPMDHYWDPLAARGEGMFTRDRTLDNGVEAPYDVPFDDQSRKEFWRNGTTRNYRTIYLQRLADPTLPWNPLPTLPDGKPNNKHNPKLPVNLYRTIDGSSADLTVFNGASSREPAMDSALRGDNFWLPTENRADFERVYSKTGRTTPGNRLSFRSLERGLHDKDWAGDAATGGLPVTPRALWRQEPVSTFDPADSDTDPKKNTMLEYLTQRASGPAAIDWLKKRFNDLRLRDVGNPNSGLKGQLLLDLEAIQQGYDSHFATFPPSLLPKQSHFDFVLKHTLGFQNEAFGALETRVDAQNQGAPVSAIGTPQPDGGFARSAADTSVTPSTPIVVNSTFPWLAWNNRPFVSAGELLNVPGKSSSQMLRKFSTMNRNLPANQQPNPYNGLGLGVTIAQRLALFEAPFGHLLNIVQTSNLPSATDTTKSPWEFSGAPHFYRILEYVYVPSRFVGTETLLTAEVFNDMPGPPNNDLVGADISTPDDPRYKFQPPFHKVARERDPGKVNLNTVTGRRGPINGAMRHWSEVFDGIMHREKDSNPPGQVSHLGPAWRDVVLSRKGYVQQQNPAMPIDPISGFGSIEKSADGAPPDVLQFGLNSNFPSFFSNPFRSPDAGDLVPLQQMVHFGVDASWLRRHHFNRGGRGTWGSINIDDNNDGTIDETREAGYSGDDLIVGVSNELLPLPSTIPSNQSGIPLFSESFTGTCIDGERNPYFYYQPMTRMENLVTNRSNVFAIWVTIGYFEVEPAPNWNDPDPAKKQAVRVRFGATMNDNDPATVTGLALYNRVYPDGYMLGREIGSDTGDVKRPRGFYIVDRTEEVGFKPGEDLNVEKMIKLRRRIE